MHSYFLPIGLFFAFLFAWFFPESGQRLEQQGLIPWMVVIIFLIHGYQTRLHQITGDASLIKTVILAILINLLISPFLGLAVVSLLHIPPGLALGLVVISTVPATLSSCIVITQIAGGSGPKALIITILLNIIGVFSIPFILELILEQMDLISLSPWPLLQQLLLIILLPFVIGILSRSIFQQQGNQWLLAYLPSTCVIGTVWLSMSASTETLGQLNLPLLLWIILASISIHGGLMLLCWLSRFLHPSERGEWLALLFTASQKTLPVAVGVLTALEQPAGLALLACILFHFQQLFIDSILASWLEKSSLKRFWS